MSNGPIDIAHAVSAHRKEKITVRATSSNRASLMGRECTRQIVYERTRWQEKQLHDEGLQAIFDLGNAIEDIALADIRAAGFRVVQQQRDLALPAYEITGHIDAAIEMPDKSQVPIDVKSMSPHIFPTVNSPLDFFDHKHAHVRAYPAQILLYGHMMAADWGVLYCVNKSTNQSKDIWFKITDYTDVIEALKEKALEIKKHVHGGTLPDRTTDLGLCEKCAFNHICLPDKQFGPAVDIVADPDFLAALDLWYASKDVAATHDELDKEIKARIKSTLQEAPGKSAPMATDGHTTGIPSPARGHGRREFLAGNYSITVTTQKRKKWEVEENLMKMIGSVKETPVQVVKIERRENASTDPVAGR